MIERFIVKRYLQSKRRLSFITIISRFSMLGVSVGVAALLIVLAVFNGFGSIAKKMLISAEPHIQISFKKNPTNSEIQNLTELLRNNSKIKTYYKFVEGKVILSTSNGFKVLKIKGIEDSIFNSSNFGLKKYVSNKLITKKKKLYISLTNAIKMNLHIGEDVKLTTFQSLEKSAVTLSFPKIAMLKIAGIFSTPNNELNSNLIFASYNDVKFLFSKKNRLSGFDILLKDYKQAATVKKELKKLFPENLTIKTWGDNHKQLLNMMKIERLSAFILLSLIIAIATFNILSSLTMSVIVKQKDIAVMRAFGVTKKSIKKIFLWEGLLIGIKGTFYGFLGGMLLYFAQLNFKIYPLDPTKYILDALPVKLDFIDISLILLTSLGLSFLSALYPSKEAAKVNINEAIKWE